MKGHLKHLVMCAPMLVVAVILVASGVGVASLLPVVACVGMMWLMMRMMGEGPQHEGHEGGMPGNGSEGRSS